MASVHSVVGPSPKPKPLPPQPQHWRVMLDPITQGGVMEGISMNERPAQSHVRGFWGRDCIQRDRIAGEVLLELAFDI